MANNIVPEKIQDQFILKLVSWHVSLQKKRGLRHEQITNL
jgi:hypothetical protein